MVLLFLATCDLSTAPVLTLRTSLRATVFFFFSFCSTMKVLSLKERVDVFDGSLRAGLFLPRGGRLLDG